MFCGDLSTCLIKFLNDIGYIGIRNNIFSHNKKYEIV